MPKGAIEDAIEDVVRHFRQSPGDYFTEEDVRWRLMERLTMRLCGEGHTDLALKDGKTSPVHGEYPTPFRCWMSEHRFEVAARDSRAHRGHFDIVVLNPVAIRSCSFEAVRAQNYQVFLKELALLSRPLVECVVELKLLRNLSYAQHAELAAQAVKKVAAALTPQREYYTGIFARQGVVLLFDNSGLSRQNEDIRDARRIFLEAFLDLVSWNRMPEALVCRYITPDKEQEFRGKGLLI